MICDKADSMEALAAFSFADTVYHGRLADVIIGNNDSGIAMNALRSYPVGDDGLLKLYDFLPA
jgi:hypothetical protein